jgi:pyruvate dehydrogenase E2 component (dihydrolipoamide acetyltransferase)
VDGVMVVIGEKGENIDEILKSMETKEEEAPKDDASKARGAQVDTSNINASLITMPKMSDTMTDGTIANWLKKVGDEVKAGDILAEVETDKATLELEAYEDGKLLYVGVKAGDSAPVDGVIAHRW